ncbi:MAG: hypothetical protein AAFR66_02245, partial [Bacteroidota bacterium]
MSSYYKAPSHFFLRKILIAIPILFSILNAQSIIEFRNPDLQDNLDEVDEVDEVDVGELKIQILHTFENDTIPGDEIFIFPQEENLAFHFPVNFPVEEIKLLPSW